LVKLFSKILTTSDFLLLTQSLEACVFVCVCERERENEVGERYRKKSVVLLAAPFKFKSSYENKNVTSCCFNHPRGEIYYRSEKRDQFSGKFAALHNRNDTALRDLIFANL